MYFTPLRGGFKQSLIGVATPGRFVDVTDQDNRLYPKRRPGTDNSNAIILVIITAILFVTIISIYDVIRNIINNHYASKALRDPLAHNDPQDIESTLIGNKEGLIASIVFAVLCLITGGILIYILLKYI